MIDTGDKLPDDITLKKFLRLMTCVIKDGDKFYPQLFLEEALHYEQTKLKAYKKDLSKELMFVAWHPTRWQNWCLPENEKKGIGPIFADKVGKG